jgi:hypothetical protein
MQEQCRDGNGERQERRPTTEQSRARAPTPPPQGRTRNND